MNIIVREYLINRARKPTNQTISYQELSDTCKLGLNMGIEFDRKEIGKILGEISRFEYSQNKERPLISALVVTEGGGFKGGDGFYKLAEELGLGKWRDIKKEGILYDIHITKSIAFWKDDKNYIEHKNI